MFQNQKFRHQAVRLDRTTVVGIIQRRKSLLKPFPTDVASQPIQFMARIRGSVKRVENTTLRHVVNGGHTEKMIGISGQRSKILSEVMYKYVNKLLSIKSLHYF